MLLLLLALVAPPPASGRERPVTLHPVCGDSDADHHDWVVRNSGRTAVDYRWELVGSGQQGTGTVGAGAEDTFSSAAHARYRMMRLFVDGKRVDAERACVGAPSTVGTVAVQVALDDGSGGPGATPPAGVVVRLDGQEVGTTDSAGRFTFTAEAGDHVVQAVLPSLASGEAPVTVTAGRTSSVTVVLFDGEVLEPADLELVELVNGGLPLDASSLTLRLVSGGEPVVLTHLWEVELTALNPNVAPVDLTSRFTLDASGQVVAADVASVLSVIAPILSDARLRVSGSDARGFSYEETIRFAPGSFSLQIQLEAPPSQPDLEVAGREVTVTFGNGITLPVTVDANGFATVPGVPGGSVTVGASAIVGDQTYGGTATFGLGSDRRLILRLLGVEDIVAGVVPWQLSAPVTPPAPLALAATAAAAVAERHVPAAAAATAAADVAAEVADLAAGDAVAAAAEAVSVTVSGGAEGVAMTRAAALTVPQGTAQVTLRYVVATAEYPTYVLQQSRYNDTWQLRVLGGSGQPLFQIGRSVNSQLFSPPTWNASGSTGELQETIDVSGLTQDSQVVLTLVATTTNIGDSILPTSVSATLAAEEADLTVDTVVLDTLANTTGDSDHVSVPRPGATNTLHRDLDVTYTKPDDVTLTRVRVELLSSTGAVLQEVLDAAPGAPGVTVVSDTTLQARATLADASTVASTPPPGDRLRYRVTVEGRRDDGSTVTSEPRDSVDYTGLWRMPDGIDRYGMRDQGGDDWAASSTYTWMDTNRDLVTRVDDISGEHGRNIGHQTHATGKDIDMFHVYTLPGGAVSGTQNYLQLGAAVTAAVAGDAAQQAQVTAWATETRDHFDLLLANADVRRLYYAVGSPNAAPTLGTGWARDLLTQGTFTAPNGTVLDLGIGVWGNAGNGNIVYNAVHNNHFHVALR